MRNSAFAVTAFAASLFACGESPANVYLTVEEPKPDIVVVPDIDADSGAPDSGAGDAQPDAGDASDAPNTSDASDAPVSCNTLTHEACVVCCQTPAGLAVIAEALQTCACRGNYCQSECGTYDWNADAGTGTPYCSGGPQNPVCVACLASVDNEEAGGCAGAVEEACGSDPACYGMTGCESTCPP
jgi:hypothetical protein